MEGRPDNIERWGAREILTEARRLLLNHFHLFLPFYFAFFFPISAYGIFYIVFVGAPGTTLPPYMSFIKSIYTAAQGREIVAREIDIGAGEEFPIVNFVVSTLVSAILGSLAVASFTYIIAYIYSDDGELDERAIFKRVLKFLPHALLRVLVTQLWLILLLILAVVACGFVAGILFAIISALNAPDPAAGLSSGFAFLIALSAVCIIFTIRFMFVNSVALLEPEKYGRAALRTSVQLAKGRAGLVSSIVGMIVFLGWLINGSTQTIATTTLPLWEMIILGIVLSLLNSGLTAYITTVQVVLYFVCKSNDESLLTSCILESQQRDRNSAGNPHEPLIHANMKPKLVEEP